MSGSAMQLQSSKKVENQLPLKGFTAPFTDARSGRVFLIEGMGDGRYRIKTPIRQPRKK